MSDRRRKTLATLRPSAANARPAGAENKRLSYAPASKASLGGGAGRASLGGRRSSVAGRRSSVAGRRSSVAAASRRSSVYGRGGKVKDPRPIGDKPFHQENIKRLITFLSSHGYDSAISVKLLTSPTSQDFRRITHFLVTCLDERFQFGDKFEEEFRTLLKTLGYPVNISKSSLTAPGSPVTWPALLAALVWIIEVVEYSEAEAKEEEATSDLNLPEEKVFFYYLTSSYAEWLGGEDNSDFLDQGLADIFAKRDALINERCEQLEAEVSRLDTEIATLRASADQLAELRTKKTNLLSDQAKFAKLNEKLVAHQATLGAKLEERQQELATLEAELAASAEEKASLETTIREQPVTPHEVQRMNQERALREESLAQVRTRKDEVNARAWELEMGIAKGLQRLEQAVNAFNDRGSELLLIPASAKNNVDRVELELELNPSGGSAREILGRDLQRAVKPALIRLREIQLDRIRQAQEELRDVTDRCDHQRSLRTERETETADLKVRVERAEAHFVEERKSVNAELEALIEQVAAVEREVQQMQTATAGALAASAKQVQQVEMETDHFDQTSRDEFLALNEELCTMMDAISSHKENVTQALEGMLSRAQQVRDSVVA